jgi:hypothetical protein
MSKFWKDVNALMKNRGYVPYGTYDCNKCGTKGVNVQYIKNLGAPDYLSPPEQYKPGAKRWTLLGSEVQVVHCHKCGAMENIDAAQTAITAT